MNNQIFKTDGKGQIHCFPVRKPPYNLNTHLNDLGGHSFGSRRADKRLHAGIDLYNPRGSEVYSMQNGTVLRVAPFYAGSYAIEIDHGTMLARYCETATFGDLEKGDTVKAGDLIGFISKLDTTTMTMLHLETYSNTCKGDLTDPNNPQYYRRKDLINPQKYLQWLIS